MNTYCLKRKTNTDNIDPIELCNQNVVFVRLKSQDL